MPAPKKFKPLDLVPKSATSPNNQKPPVIACSVLPIDQSKLIQKELKTSESEVRPKAELLTTSQIPQDGPLMPPIVNSSGGGTKKYNKDYLKDRWTTLSGRMMDWLNEGDRLETLMAETKLRDLGVMLGIATEKVLLLEGQPTQIIGQPQHQALDRLGLALKDALEKRGLVTLTERKVDIKLDGPGTSQQTPRSSRPE